MKKALGSLAGTYIALSLVGSLLFAGYAEMAKLEPALTIIELQSLWNEGMYGVFITYFTTFVFLLFVTLSPVVLITVIANFIAGLFGPKPPRVEIPMGSTMSWRRDSSLLLFLASVGVAVLCGFFFFTVLTAPEKLSFLGSSGGFALFFGIFAVPVSIAIFFDAILPKRWDRGRIDGLEREILQSGSASGKHIVKIGEKKFTIDSKLAEKLKSADDVAFRTSAVFSRVVEIRR